MGKPRTSLNFQKLPLLPSTGDHTMPSPQLRTKDNVDHAGLSPPLVPLKVLMPSNLDPSNPSLSNNSSPAPNKPTDAMVDSWTTLSNISNLLVPLSNPHTHTPPDKEEFPPANPSPLLDLFPDSDVRVGSKSQFKAAVAQQPVSVAIEADQMAFQAYTSGVISSGCGTQLDHGVLAVGYGTMDGTEYALVKNSWGASWGDEGYVRTSIDNNSCGVMNSASYPHA